MDYFLPVKFLFSFFFDSSLRKVTFDFVNLGLCHNFVYLSEPLRLFWLCVLSRLLALLGDPFSKILGFWLGQIHSISIFVEASPTLTVPNLSSLSLPVHALGMRVFGHVRLLNARQIFFAMIMQYHGGALSWASVQSRTAPHQTDLSISIHTKLD